MTPLPERRARDFEQREADILAAAVQLFSGDTWQTVTIEQVASAVAIGKGTIYKHFTSKDELYARLALDFHRRVLVELEQIDADLPVLDRLRAVLRILWAEHHSGTDVQRVVQYCERDDFRRAISPETRAQFEALDAAFGALILALLREGVATGQLSNSPLPMLLFKAHSALFGAIRHAHRCRAELPDGTWAPEPGCDELRDEIVEFIIAGLTSGAQLTAN